MILADISNVEVAVLTLVGIVGVAMVGALLRLLLMVTQLQTLVRGIDQKLEDHLDQGYGVAHAGAYRRRRYERMPPMTAQGGTEDDPPI